MRQPEQLTQEATFGFTESAEVSAMLQDVVDFDWLEKLCAEPPDVITEETVANVVKVPGFYGEHAVRCTPLTEAFVRWDHLRAFDKHETEQAVHAFKVRGAHMHGRQIMEQFPDTKHIVAYSAGNHGLGVALFVRWWNEQLVRTGQVRVDDEGCVLAEDRDKLLQAHIFVKEDASPDKVALLRKFGRYGTTLHIKGKSLEDAKQEADSFIAAHNVPGAPKVAQLLHPYNEAAVMAGQATILPETVMQLRAQGVDLRERPLVVDVAGGGFGMAIGLAACMDELIMRGLVHPASYVRASQMEGCDSMVRAIGFVDRGAYEWPDLFQDTAGEAGFDASADGTAVYSPDPGNVARVHYLRGRGVLQVETVSKLAVAQRMDLRRRQGTVVEPAGAIGGARRNAWLLGREPYWLGDADGSVCAADAAILVAIESGGNASPDTTDEFDAVITEHANAGATNANLLGGVVMRTAAHAGHAVRKAVRPGRRPASGAGPRPVGRRGLEVF